MENDINKEEIDDAVADTKNKIIFENTSEEPEIVIKIKGKAIWILGMTVVGMTLVLVRSKIVTNVTSNAFNNCSEFTISNKPKKSKKKVGCNNSSVVGNK